MELKLYTEDNIRVVSDYKRQNFIDIRSVGYESMAIDLFLHFQYVEIRRKEDKLRIFTFIKKSMKKECDFGWWKDAEVVFSVNEQIGN